MYVSILQASLHLGSRLEVCMYVPIAPYGCLWDGRGGPGGMYVSTHCSYGCVWGWDGRRASRYVPIAQGLEVCMYVPIAPMGVSGAKEGLKENAKHQRN